MSSFFTKLLLPILFVTAVASAQSPLPGGARISDKQLASEILSNKNFDIIMQKGRALLKTGFNAGSGYAQVWIRDFNTFINYSLKVRPQSEVRNALLKFFYFQEFDGDMVDGYEQIGPHAKIDYYGRFTRYDMPGYAFHKNTVEADQESSLIQAVYKYVMATGDTSFLHEVVHGKTVLRRMELALGYMMNFRYDRKYGMMWNAATADWGDVQFHSPWGVKLDQNSDPACSIYTNAMFLIALHDFVKLSPDTAIANKWERIHNEIAHNVMKYLWDPKHDKFIPHLYIKCNPFRNGFDENKIYYHGGTAVAIEAGLLSKKQVLQALHKMEQDVKDAGAQSIGLTMYPPYPPGTFANKGMEPYHYQNGGDWTWFGARMITDLVRYGYIRQAYREIQPFVDRVVKNDGFYEWYTIEGKPEGSSSFRGSAGVLMQAIGELRAWAKANE